jgi:outer membrane protein TolC
MKIRHLAWALLFAVLLPRGAGAQDAATGGPRTFTLEQALQYALDHYPTVRIALESVHAATANVEAARGAYWPRLDAIWQSHRGTANNVFGQLLPQSVVPSISGPVLPANAHSVWGSATGALLSWEPVDFGLRDALVREADLAVARSRADESVTRLAVQNAVGGAFLAVVGAQQTGTAAAADVQRRTVLARSAHALVDNELRPGVEASRADAELAAARTRSIQASQMLAAATSTLTQLLGITDGSVTVSAGRLIESRAAAATSGAATPEHPLLRSGQAAIDAAHAREDVLARTNRPRLYLQSSLSARGSGAEPDGRLDGGLGGLALDRINWAAGVMVVVPNLFEFSSLRARRAAAGAATRAERARYDEVILAITGQQRTAAAAVDAARAIAENTPVQLAAARQSETQARARYDAGLATIVEVAEAQNLLAAAEFQDAAAKVEVWRALLAQAAAQGNLTGFVDAIRAAGAP